MKNVNRFEPLIASYDFMGNLIKRKETINVGFKKLRNDVNLPKYARQGDAGFDFEAAETITIPPHKTIIVNTGLAVQLPNGYELQVRCRSGIAAKTPLIVKNAPGTVDSGYRGEIGIILHNLSDEEYLVNKGDRIAQGVICELPTINIIEINNLSESERGVGGFGSTGV